MANHHHYHLPPHPAHPAHPSYSHPPPPGTPLATNGSAASPVPAAMPTPSARGAAAAAAASAVAPVIPHPATQLPALQKLAQANEQTWLLIGTVAEQMNDLDRALAAYEHAIRHNPHSIAGLNNIAGIARSRENYSMAVDYFQRVLSLQRENGDVWSALGHCFLMKDDLQNAYSAYQQALYYLPNPKLQDPKLWYGIGILYDRYGSLEHAEEAFSSVLRMDKDFDKADEIFFRLGIIYKQQQKYEEALKCFERIHRNPPAPLTNIDIWFQIGHVYEQMKDYTAAKDAYERVLKDSPNHAKVLQQLGWLYHQAGAPFANQDTAIVLLTKSLESDPADPQSWYLLGRAYMAGQKYQKAYESYQQAVYRDGRNPTFWCSIGVLYYNINQFRDALDAYSRAIRINPYISEVWFDLGSLYESCNNQISDAIDAYARAAELDPGNPHITQRLNLLRNVQANGGTLPAAPGPQDIHPTAYAGGGPMNPMHTPVGPPPPLTGGPAIGSAPSRPGRPDSRGPPPDAIGGSSRELPALGLNGPNARGGSPPPFHAPPPVQLDESGRGSSTRLPQMAPMDLDRAPSSTSLFRSQSQGPNANPNQLPPPPALAAGAPGYPESNRRTRSPSPHHLPPPGNYAARQGPNSHGPGSGYPGAYPNGDPAWERDRSGRDRERERDREMRDRESDRESRSGRARQPSGADRVKVEILNQQQPSERFFQGRGGPSSPIAPRYDPRRSPPPVERPPAEGRSPYMHAPPQPNASYPGYWDRERERPAPAKAPSRQHSPAPRDAPASSNSRRYDPRMDIDQESPRREYWPDDQPHPGQHPVDRDRYNATPDGARRGRGPELPPHGSESPIPGGSGRGPAPESVGKAARRRGAQAAAPAPVQPPPPAPKEKKERKPPTKRGGREGSVVPPEREMSAPAPRVAPSSAPTSQAAPQHPTFKVTLGDNNSNALPPPPLPGTASANHHRSQSGSNGSARSRATPSPTMGPPRREVDEDYDEGVADALMGLSGLKSQAMRSRTASVHSVASPGPHGQSSMRHDAFAPPVNRSPPVSTARSSSPYGRPTSAIPAHPPSPQSMRNGGPSGRSPPSSFARRGSEQPRDKTPSSLKRGMDDDASGPLEKRHRVDVLNHPVPTVFPPPPSTDARSSPSVGLGRTRFDPVLSAADVRMDTDSPKGEPTLPPIATLPQPPDSPPRGAKGDVDDGRSASERSGGSRTSSPVVRAENGA
ncbi:General transcriptional corepressor ssn6 OS=Schizosaccharomyces pombe (strain 972 / ATCC 24843) GN=ssn6 PE=1 SV=1 [Rhizoctonia solani AG-1 IB]|uniref:General transcriptional corepressor ssn6 n=1 Tax=Thanatephorus cucumeris (strain AG1-IB / isolate 7/3/14) TaxID=1108050 RepID=A0A0B7FPY6_THACB|nr:General transcriptional corepressor ssn6 OS=Schizosaccharomyces pombe (strain 972 / ATCC 24843) GN=ssn6 PE=1 SV=1 [Rhizoctonia solani AG-1 IB]